MRLVICPGIHDPKLTDCFLAGLSEVWESENPRQNSPIVSDVKIFPAHKHPPFSALDTAYSRFVGTRHCRVPPVDGDRSIWGVLHKRGICCMLHFLCSQELAGESLVFVSFSAGVVGAIGAALLWQQIGGKVGAFIALDGWGVPLGGNFPIHRLSHDRFTHWSSAILGGGGDGFYADPPVEHLDLWREPQTAKGWQISHTADGFETATPATAATFLVHLLKHYGVQSVV